MMAITVYTGNKFYEIWRGRGMGEGGITKYSWTPYVGVNHIDRAAVGSLSSFKLSIEECDERRRFNVSTSSCI